VAPPVPGVSSEGSSLIYPLSFSEDVAVDLSSQDAFNEGAPFATFARMRAEDPIAWCEEQGGRGFWSVTRHADLVRLNRQPELLSSARGIRIEDQTAEEFEARKTFQETDPPQHRYFRMLVNKAFSRGSMALYTDAIRGMIDDILDDALSMAEFDAVDAIARQLPMRMLGRILGVPDEDTPFLVEKGDALISNADPDYTDWVVDKIDTDEYRLLPFRSPAAVALFDYANELIARMDGGEPLGVLNLVREETSDGRRMSDAEFRNFFCLLVAAGNDTTRYAIAATLQALANDPGLLDRIRHADDALLDTATDEMIRWAAPTTHFRRTALRDFDLHGRTVRAGDKVVLWFIAGNRDEAAIAAPDTIDISRKPNPFLSFGQGGPHVCLGMWLAKLEVRLVMREFAQRVATVEQTGRHSFLRSNFIHGIKKLPLRVTRQ
jgi:cytochrome P450